MAVFRETCADEDEEIRDKLRRRGFDENLINTVLMSSRSRNIDDLVLCMERIKNDPNVKPEDIDRILLEEEIARKKADIERDRKYRERVNNMIKSDSEERKHRCVDFSRYTSGIATDVEKVAKRGDCTVKVWFCGESRVLYFRKSDTLSTLFREIKKEFNLSGKLKLFSVVDGTTVGEECGGKLLSECGLVPTGVLRVLS